MKKEVKKEVTELKRVCAWCKKDLGVKKLEKPQWLKKSETITHGICDDCFKKQMEGLRKRKKEK